MSSPREKRRSCESCRTRKLRCSGQDSAGLGCSKCRALSITCRFREQGAPGRPRKHRGPVTKAADKDASSRDVRRANTQLHSPPSTVDETLDLDQVQRQQPPPQVDTAAAVTESSQVASCGLDQDLFSKIWQGLPASCQTNEFSGADPAPGCSYDCGPQSQTGLFDGLLGTGQLSASYREPNEAGTGPASFHGPEQSAAPRCVCAQNVFETLRSLKATPTSHSLVRVIRQGTDIVERLLTCPVCYDLSKPPRITIQNVLLVGRLIYGIAAAYRRYVRWFRESSKDATCSQGVAAAAAAAAMDKSETVYLRPAGLEMIDPALSFTVSAAQVRELVIQGLQTDAQRLAALGRQFALRQLNRHIIGHEACPTADGGCWKEEYESDSDLDPLDICPLNPAARVLTPCFRVVDVAEAMIKQVIELLG